MSDRVVYTPLEYTLALDLRVQRAIFGGQAPLGRWTSRLDDIVDWLIGYGFEFQLDYSPTECWPDEATPRPEGDRWGCFFTGVPGTDMCVAGHRDRGRALAIIGAALEAVTQIKPEAFVPLEWWERGQG